MQNADKKKANMPMALKGGGVWNRGRWWWQWAWLVGVDALPKCCFNTFSTTWTPGVGDGKTDSSWPSPAKPTSNEVKTKSCSTFITKSQPKWRGGD